MASQEEFSEASQPIATRIRSALVTVLTDEETLSNGSGVLVRLGGVEFVLTAGHVPWRKSAGRLNQIAAFQGVEPFFFIVRPGDGSVARTIHAPLGPEGYPEPDVAVLELGPDPKLLPSRRPFEEAEIAHYDNDGPSRRILLVGFPRGSIALRGDLPNLGGAHPPIDGRVIAFEAPTLPHHRSRYEPAAGRGVHVFLEFEGTIVSHAEGISGGPLVVPEDSGLLVGLARSIETCAQGFDQWCEPVVEAVKLLLDHSNPEVAAAAHRIVARLTTCAAGPKVALE